MRDLPEIEYKPENLFSIASSHADLMERMIGDFIYLRAGTPNGMSARRWRKILLKIEEGFAAVDPLMNTFGLSDKRRNKLCKKFDKGMELFVKYYFDLWY